MVINHTVDVNGANQAGVRWYELRKSGAATWQVYQQSTFAPDAHHRWMGSAAMNGQGEIGLGYSISSTSLYPSIRYTGRLPGDPLGQMTRGEGSIVNGGGYQTHTSGRWGDYSMLAVDPLDDCTFWFTSQYYQTTSSYGWQTRVGKFQLSTCTPMELPPSVIITSPPDGAVVSGLIYIYATAYDDQPVTQVEFFVDGASIGKDQNGSDGWSMPWDSSQYPNGSHAIRAVVTDSAGQTGSDTNTVTTSNTTQLQMHVGDLDGSSVKNGSSRWDATVTITVHDKFHNSVSGVKVTGSWSGSKSSVSCTTNSSGMCSVKKTRISNSTASIQFTVKSLSAASYTYTAAANHDPDGSSNGTLITVNKP